MSFAAVSFPMQVIRSPRSMQKLALELRQQGLKVAFVPTMGALHEGHLSLVKRARREVGDQGIVITSLFVNPTQFGPNEDFNSYPRTEKTDLKLCKSTGVNIVFAPNVDDVYRPDATTVVREDVLSLNMEGGSRPGHFVGVTTIVTKLFNLVLPEVAVFGQKDYQQAAVIRRMVRDLNQPLRIVVAPTFRDPDGLALSSRNRYLSAEERRQATILWECLCAIREYVREKKKTRAATLRKMVEKMVEQCPLGSLDYVSFFDAETLQPCSTVVKGNHMALAVRFGKTRLIDNARLR